jgi:hypothetical protein
VRQKTGRTRFFITREALEKPDSYIAGLLKQTGDDRLHLSPTPDDLLKG